MAASRRRSSKKTDIQKTIFAMPVLLGGEDGKALRKLADRITKTVKPKDVLEEMWVADIVHLQWEVQRIRECKVQLLHAKHEEGLRELLASILGDLDAEALLRKRKLGLDQADEEIQSLLKSHDFSMKSVTAQTMALYVEELERFDRMAASTEVRRNHMLREIEFHREALARNLRRACEVPQDAEFTEIEPARSIKTKATDKAARLEPPIRPNQENTTRSNS